MVLQISSEQIPNPIGFLVREVLDVMLRLAAQGRTMLIVTHEMQFAKSIADRIIFMDKGQIVEESEPEKFFTMPKTERARKFLDIFEFYALNDAGSNI